MSVDWISIEPWDFGFVAHVRVFRWNLNVPLYGLRTCGLLFLNRMRRKREIGL